MEGEDSVGWFADSVEWNFAEAYPHLERRHFFPAMRPHLGRPKPARFLLPRNREQPELQLLRTVCELDAALEPNGMLPDPGPQAGNEQDTLSAASPHTKTKAVPENETVYIGKTEDQMGISRISLNSLLGALLRPPWTMNFSD